MKVRVFIRPDYNYFLTPNKYILDVYDGKNKWKAAVEAKTYESALRQRQIIIKQYKIRGNNGNDNM